MQDDNGLVLQQPLRPPTLMEMLYDRFRLGLCKKFGEDSDEVTKHMNSAKLFFSFSSSYLDNNRPVTISSAVDRDLIITFTDNSKCTIAGVTTEEVGSGSMAPVSGSPIDSTPGRPITRTMFTEQGAVPITGNTKKSKEMIDYSDPGYGGKAPYIDKKAPRLPAEYNPKDGYQVNDDMLNR